MSTLAPLIEAWEEGHGEFAISLRGISQEELWKRPHPRLLSVGELTGHVAYWQAVWVTGGGNMKPDLETLPIKGPFIDNAFRYYTGTVEHPFSLPMDAKQALEELMRVHEAAKAFVASKEKDEKYPGQWETWGNLIQYQAFHVAYHCGQVYSARHLMGHETEDN